MMPDQSHDPAATPTHLPALLPPTATLLHRTQTTLGLLRDVSLETSPDYWYNKGKAALKPGGIEEAVFAFRQCLDRAPSHWQAALQLASLLAHKFSEDTITIMQQAIRPYYEGSISWELWSEYYYGMPNIQRQLIQMYLELHTMAHGQSRSISFILSLIYEANYDLEKAKRTLGLMNLHHQDFTDDSLLWQLHSGHLLQLTDSVESLKYFNRAIELSPNDGMLYYERGTTKLFLDDYDGALSDYTHAIKLKFDAAWVYYNRASLKHKIHDYEGALKDYDASLMIRSDSSSVLRERARVKKVLGDTTGAATDIKTAKRIDKALLNR